MRSERTEAFQAILRQLKAISDELLDASDGKRAISHEDADWLGMKVEVAMHGLYDLPPPECPNCKAGGEVLDPDFFGLRVHQPPIPNGDLLRMWREYGCVSETTAQPEGVEARSGPAEPAEPECPETSSWGMLGAGCLARYSDAEEATQPEAVEARPHPKMPEVCGRCEEPLGDGNHTFICSGGLTWPNHDAPHLCMRCLLPFGAHPGRHRILCRGKAVPAKGGANG